MAEIGMQDPLTTEVQSPTVAGIIEALHRISGSLDMKSEKITNVVLSPVPGLNKSNPRRIYQAPGGSRIWLNYPEPTIYLNGSPISSGEYHYVIDYIGGSVTFTGEYSPSEQDVLSVSCVHISEGSYNYIGCELKILFSAGFAGMPFTVTSSAGESYTGVVPSSLVAYVSVKNTNTEYTISATDTSGSPHVTSVTTGQYYGQYEVSLDVFTATILVKAVKGATITAKDSAQATYTKIAGEDGNAAIYVSSADNYTITSEYNGVNSDTQIVNVSEDGASYNVTLNFITLLVTVESGSTVQAKNGLTTLSDTSDGTVLFYLPNTGTWTVTATKGDKSAETSVEASAYQQYSVELTYEDSATDILNDNTWEVIHKISQSGQAASYWEVGDTKSIILNGTVGIAQLNSLSIDTFILGINHNSQKENAYSIHFAIGKISNNFAAMCDQKYGQAGGSSCFCINSSASNGGGNSGGWASSDMRNTILGNNATPAYPTSGSLLSALPYDLRLVLNSTPKYTDNVGGGGMDSVSSNVTKTNDYLFLLSEYEVFGNPDFSNSYESNYQRQYEYFASGNSKIAYKNNFTSVGSPVMWWLRSPSIMNAYTFCIVSDTGSSAHNHAQYSDGVVAAFSV